LAICLPFFFAAQLEQPSREVALYRGFVVFATMVFALVFMAPALMARGTQQSPDLAPSLAVTQIKDDLYSLPVSSHRDLLPLPPAPLQQAPAAPNSSEQTLSRSSCDCREIRQEEMQERHSQQLRASLLKLQTDKKHGVHIYLANQAQKRGRIVSVGVDSFLLKVAKDKPEITILYRDISWVTKEPTGEEKFGRGLGLTVVLVLLAPFWVPIMLLWAASGGD
jgi:hypothetical protein